jgi:hypothetical protein
VAPYSKNVIQKSDPLKRSQTFWRILKDFFLQCSHKNVGQTFWRILKDFFLQCSHKNVDNSPPQGITKKLNRSLKYAVSKVLKSLF